MACRKTWWRKCVPGDRGIYKDRRAPSAQRQTSCGPAADHTFRHPRAGQCNFRFSGPRSYRVVGSNRRRVKARPGAAHVVRNATSFILTARPTGSTILGSVAASVAPLVMACPDRGRRTPILRAAKMLRGKPRSERGEIRPPAFSFCHFDDGLTNFRRQSMSPFDLSMSVTRIFRHRPGMSTSKASASRHGIGALSFGKIRRDPTPLHASACATRLDPGRPIRRSALLSFRRVL
jgi:hypothetical protein